MMGSGIQSALTAELLTVVTSHCQFLYAQITMRKPVPPELLSAAIRDLECLAALLSVRDGDQ